MPATVTLSSTTLTRVAQAGDKSVQLLSTSGVYPGLRLFVDDELMEVVSLGLGTDVNVLRGRDGTPATMHDSGSEVWLGRADQFYSQDPQGAPHEIIAVSPYINTSNGAVWFAQGDALPTPEARRWWQKQTTTYEVGALGARTETKSPTSST